MKSTLRRVKLADVRSIRSEVGDTVTERSVAAIADDAEASERPVSSETALRMLAAAMKYLSNRNVRMQVELQFEGTPLREPHSEHTQPAVEAAL